jgi:hypothetical protein
MVRISWRRLGGKSGGEIVDSGIFINLDAEKMMKLNLFKIFENVRSFGIMNFKFWRLTWKQEMRKEKLELLSWKIQ